MQQAPKPLVNMPEQLDTVTGNGFGLWCVAHLDAEALLELRVCHMAVQRGCRSTQTKMQQAVRLVASLPATTHMGCCQQCAAGGCLHKLLCTGDRHTLCNSDNMPLAVT